MANFIAPMLREKWKNKRDSFRRRLKAVKDSKRSGAGATVVKKDRYFDQMSFLMTYIEDKKYAIDFIMVI